MTIKSEGEALRVRKRLGEMLIEAELLTDEQLKQALIDQKRAGVKLGQFLIQRGIVSEDQIIELVSKQLKIDRYDPEAYPADPELVQMIPLDIAQKFQLVPLRKRRHLFTIAMVDPMDIRALDFVENRTNMEVEPVVCSESQLGHLISATYGMHSGISETLEDMDMEDVELDVEEGGAEGAEDLQVSSLQGMAEEAPVVRLVNSIVGQAVREGASDIHLSPEANRVQLRFRIDGRLHEVTPPPKSLMLPIISRLKILSNMDIAVSRIPQDGRFTVKMDNKEINVRTSALPTIYGENIVLRLLDMSATVYTLDRLGMSAVDRDKINKAAIKPYGLILSTGPTGSGKSTSLYAILTEINTPDINIITLEDPVEYRIDNVRQIQLNRKAGMTFASGLRSILRQDPDVIMVGEIRDGETAGISTQAALTGHRVLSTVHTNDAIGAVTRFIDMGIEPFLIASVLLVSFAQRLVRTACPHCKEQYEPPESVLEAWGFTDEELRNASFMRGHCFAVIEVLFNDEMAQDMIMRGVPSAEINRELVNAGKLIMLKEDAKQKVLRGITTLEEAASKVMT